jgi:hypothetical protein
MTSSIYRRYMKFLIVYIYVSYPQGRVGGVMDIQYSQMGELRSKLGAGMAMTFKTRDTYLLQPVTVEEVYIIYTYIISLYFKLCKLILFIFIECCRVFRNLCQCRTPICRNIGATTDGQTVLNSKGSCEQAFRSCGDRFLRSSWLKDMYYNHS